jgi:hypothetical protein
MTNDFDILYESLMGSIRQMTGMGGFNKLKDEWKKLKQEALKIMAVTSQSPEVWRRILTHSGQNFNYIAGGGMKSLDYTVPEMHRLREIKTRMDEIRAETKALGINWWKVDGTL